MTNEGKAIIAGLKSVAIIESLQAKTQLQAERIEELEAECATLRTYSEEAGKVLLDEINETSINTMSFVAAASVITQHLIEHEEDAFVVHELMAFAEDSEGETSPERYDLIVQKAGAQTFHENLKACKAANTKLKGENATLRATARAYVEAHKLMRVRFNDAEDAAAYTEAGKKLEELIDA